MDDLDTLFAAYREALPDPEPSSTFTPGVWRHIEARRSPIRLLRRLAETFVTVAALVTLFIGMLVIPNLQKAPVYSASYVDVLAAENSSQDLADAIRPESPNEALPR
jgi:hypothetical protein